MKQLSDETEKMLKIKKYKFSPLWMLSNYSLKYSKTKNKKQYFTKHNLNMLNNINACKELIVFSLLRSFDLSN